MFDVITFAYQRRQLTSERLIKIVNSIRSNVSISTAQQLAFNGMTNGWMYLRSRLSADQNISLVILNWHQVSKLRRNHVINHSRECDKWNERSAFSSSSFCCDTSCSFRHILWRCEAQAIAFSPVCSDKRLNHVRLFCFVFIAFGVRWLQCFSEAVRNERWNAVIHAKYQDKLQNKVTNARTEVEEYRELNSWINRKWNAFARYKMRWNSVKSSPNNTYRITIMRMCNVHGSYKKREKSAKTLNIQHGIKNIHARVCVWERTLRRYRDWVKSWVRIFHVFLYRRRHELWWCTLHPRKMYASGALCLHNADEKWY